MLDMIMLAISKRPNCTGCNVSNEITAAPLSLKLGENEQEDLYKGHTTSSCCRTRARNFHVNFRQHTIGALWNLRLIHKFENLDSTLSNRVAKYVTLHNSKMSDESVILCGSFNCGSVNIK